MQDPALLTTWYTPHRIKTSNNVSFLAGSYWWQVSPGAGEKFDHSKKWWTLTISVRTDDSNILTLAGSAAAVIVADGVQFDIPAGVLAVSMKAPLKGLFDLWTVTWVISGNDPIGPLALGNSALDRLERAVAGASEVYVTLTGPLRFGTKLRKEQLHNFRDLVRTYDSLPTPAVFELKAKAASFWLTADLTGLEIRRSGVPIAQRPRDRTLRFTLG